MAEPTCEQADARAGRLLHIGLDVAVRIRDEDPTSVARALDGLAPDELRDLAVLLAACVPTDKPLSDVVWWADDTRLPAALKLQPCGTSGAYKRHLRRGEEPDVACVLAYRKAETTRKRNARTAPVHSGPQGYPQFSTANSHVSPTDDPQAIGDTVDGRV
jgi:hypothetical protein